MQKKSLLVALFCGALCLTGCIKNEESASVAQVRIAKANELNSIADLNKAKAAAEAVYAQAELTLAQAEAELKKAEAALVQAEAATEKVRAELLAVQVKLAEVKVEEEKVKLQMMEADLEARLAALEAEKAAAAAAKQAWVNVLDQLLAENEIAAIENAHAIYEAQAQLDSCILATEGAKADSAKVYAAKYFQALDTVAKLQTQVIEAKVSRVLIERGAMDTRDYIYQQIDAKNEQIQENNARIAELKKYQTMDADEAQAKLEEARLAMNEAFNAYKDAEDARKTVAGSMANLKSMKTDYADGANWKNDFKDPLKEYVGNKDSHTSGTSKVYFGDHKTIDGVQYFGVYVADEDVDTDDAFIPLWTTLGSYPNYRKWADIKKTSVRYPDIDVYVAENTDFIKLSDTTYVPAKIEFDKVKEVLDGLVAEKKDAIAKDNKKFEEETVPGWIEKADSVIAVINDTLPLHKAYVDEREPGITEIEEAYFEALEADSLSKQAKKDAWNAFQNYMLKKYSNVSRSLFELRWAMQEKDDKAASDTVTYNGKLALAKQGVTMLEGELADAIEDEAKAEGAYRRALAEWEADSKNTTIKNRWITAQQNHNPKFDYTDSVGKFGDEYWNVAQGQKVAGTKAAVYHQDKLAAAIVELYARQEAFETAQENYWRGIPTPAEAETNYQTAITNLDHQQDVVDDWVTTVDKDAQKYAARKSAYETAIADLKDATDEWNPDYSPKYADEGYDDHKYVKLADGWNWVDNKGVGEYDKAGTAQAARDTAWVKLVKADALTHTTAEADKAWDVPLSKNATVADVAAHAKKVSKHWEQELKTVNDSLCKVIGVTKIEDIKDAEAKALYAAYVAAETTNEAEELKDTLLNHLYGLFNPDYIADLDQNPNTASGNGRYFPDGENAQYGWLLSSYHVDYEAQMIDFDKNEYVSIASQLFPNEVLEDWKGQTVKDENGKPLPNYAHSLAFKKEQLEAFKEKTPDIIAKYKEYNAKDLKDFTEDIQEIATKVNAYKAHETTYLAWIESLNTTGKAVNEAKKAEFDAKLDYQEALAEYKALYAVANEGMWVCWGLDKTTGEPNWGWVNIAQSIKYFEDQNKTLENDIEDLKQLLKDGKVAFQLVNQMIDEWLVVLDERLEIWLAIANQYKVIMNGYLGIVEEAVAEPVVEGDEE